MNDSALTSTATAAGASGGAGCDTGAGCGAGCGAGEGPGEGPGALAGCGAGDDAGRGAADAAINALVNSRGGDTEAGRKSCLKDTERQSPSSSCSVPGDRQFTTMDKASPSRKWTKPTVGSVGNFVASCSGVHWCKKKIEERKAVERSKAIDMSLQEEALAAASLPKVYKLLLLGSRGSGKSTIVKQMRIQDGAYESKDKNLFKPVVYSNTIQSLADIVRAMANLHIDFGNTASCESDAKKVFDVIARLEDTQPFSDDLLSAMKRLWTDNGVQECFARSNEYQLGDSAKYFLNDLERLVAKDYLPTEQDILRTSVKSTVMEGVQFQSKYSDCNYAVRLATSPLTEKVHFVSREFQCRLIDAGDHQRWEEHKRLLQCFEGVAAIMFCIAMSDYDQVKFGEDGTSVTNRLQESLKLFETISNSSMFDNHYPLVYLFLNKKDLFEEKLKKFPLTICFPEYTGNQTYEEAAEYILTKFVEKYKNENNVVYSRKTCATDTSCMQSVFNEIADSVIEHNTCPPCAVV